MRFLTVSAFFESHGGGIEIVAGALARALAARGHESRWAATSIDAAPTDGATTPVVLGAVDPLEKIAGLPMPLPSPAALARLDREVAASDIVLIHDALYAPSIAAALSARRHGKPWLLIQHIGAIPYAKWHLRAAMGAANALATRPMLKAASQLLFISDTVRAQFADLRFARPPQLMFNGVDSVLFRPADPAERDALRRQWDMVPDRRNLLFIGRFVEKKGLAVLHELARRRPDVLFLMAGGGPIDPAEWGLANVRLLGKLNREEVAGLTRAADALILPSAGEGFPLVIQEAMASGLPVYCGSESAYADPMASPFLAHAAVDLTDPAGTAARFDALLDQPYAPDRLALSTYARDHYSWPGNAERVEEIAADLIGR